MAMIFRLDSLVTCSVTNVIIFIMIIIVIVVVAATADAAASAVVVVFIRRRLAHLGRTPKPNGSKRKMAALFDQPK